MQPIEQGRFSQEGQPKPTSSFKKIIDALQRRSTEDQDIQPPQIVSFDRRLHLVLVAASIPIDPIDINRLNALSDSLHDQFIEIGIGPLNRRPGYLCHQPILGKPNEMVLPDIWTKEIIGTTIETTHTYLEDGDLPLSDLMSLQSSTNQSDIVREIGVRICPNGDALQIIKNHCGTRGRAITMGYNNFRIDWLRPNSTKPHNS